MDFPVIQYADDTLIIMPACPQQILIMKELLNRYAASTGLHINYGKSMMIPLNMTSQHAEQIAQTLGCTVGTMPFTYLGLPLS